MQDAIAALDNHSIFFNLCGWYNWYAAAGPAVKVGNAYRLATDCVGYEQMLLNIDAVAPVAHFLGNGFYPDMDMISSQAARGLSNLRPPPAIVQKRLQTQFSMIAVTGAVLLISFDVRDARNAALVRIVGNEEVIEVHQDALSTGRRGYMRRLVGGSLAQSIKSLRTDQNCSGVNANLTRWIFHRNTTAPDLKGRSSYSHALSFQACAYDAYFHHFTKFHNLLLQYLLSVRATVTTNSLSLSPSPSLSLALCLSLFVSPSPSLYLSVSPPPSPPLSHLTLTHTAIPAYSGLSPCLVLVSVCKPAVATAPTNAAPTWPHSCRARTR